MGVMNNSNASTMNGSATNITVTSIPQETIHGGHSVMILQTTMQTQLQETLQ